MHYNKAIASHPNEGIHKLVINLGLPLSFLRMEKCGALFDFKEGKHEKNITIIAMYAYAVAYFCRTGFCGGNLW